MPEPHSGPRRFDIDARGTLWIPAYAGNALWQLDPASGRFTKHALPIVDALPYVARVDDAAGVVWVGTGAADAVLRIERSTAHWSVVPLSRGAMVRHLAVNPRTHEVWVAYGASPGEITARVGRIRTD
jgi:streptogramin lyase